MINAGEASLTDGAAKVLLGGLHGGPSGRREPGVIRKKINFWEKKRVIGVPKWEQVSGIGITQS